MAAATILASRHTRPSPDSDAPHYPPGSSVAALLPPDPASSRHAPGTGVYGSPSGVYGSLYSDQYDETSARARPRPGHPGRFRGPLLHHGGRPPARLGPRPV